MEKVLAVGAATTRLHALKAAPHEAVLPQATQPPVGNAMCPVLCLEMVDFSRKPVADQLVLRERFNGRLARALEQVPLLDRMVLETSEGVAVTFLGGPEAALHVALRFAHSLQPASGSADPLQVRAGINIGPVRLTRDAGGHPLVLGDGINVAQRLLGFAAPGQFLASRAYHEALCQRVPAHRGLFLYQGSRTDTHVREHEVYELDPQAVSRDELPPPALAQSASTPVPPPSRQPAGGRRRLALAGAALSAALLFAAVLVRVFPQGAEPTAATAGRATAQRNTLERPLVLSQKTLLPTPAAVQPDDPPAVEASPDISLTGTAVPSQTPGDPLPTAGPAAAAPPAQSAAPSGQTMRRATAKARPTSRPVDKRPPPRSTAAPLQIAPASEPVAARAPMPTPPTDTAEPQASADAWKAPPTISLPVPASPKKPPTALVVLAVSPWGEVFVDGRSMGVSPPLRELELAQGKHRIVVRNSDFKPYDEEIELGSNETMRIKHKFVRR